MCQWPASDVRISTVLRPRSPTTSTLAAALMTYRKDGTAVASSVSFLSRDNTFEVRPVPFGTAHPLGVPSGSLATGDEGSNGFQSSSSSKRRRYPPCAPLEPPALSVRI